MNMFLLQKKIILLVLIFIILFSSFLIIPQKTQARLDKAEFSRVLAAVALCNPAATISMAGSVLEKIFGTTALGTGNPTAASPSDTATKLTSGQMFKECVMDPAANALKNIIIERMTDSILNSGNEGGRGGQGQYVKNFGDYFRESFDKKIGDIVYNSNLGFLCNGFEFPIKAYLQLTFYGTREEKNKCTLSQIEQNFTNAIDDVERYYSDWRNFTNIMVDIDNNNPFAIAFSMKTNISKKQYEENKKKKDDVDRSKGMISLKKCKKDVFGDDNQVAEDIFDCMEGCPEDGDGSCEIACEFDTARPGILRDDDLKDADCEIVTPGSLIQSGIDRALGTEQSSLQLADEFDEIFTALIGALITKAMRGGGLASYDGLNENMRGQDPMLKMKRESILTNILNRSNEQFLIDAGKVCFVHAQMLLDIKNNLFKNNEKCWVDRTSFVENGELGDIIDYNQREVDADDMGTMETILSHNVTTLSETLRQKEENRWKQGSLLYQEISADIESVLKSCLGTADNRGVKKSLCVFKGGDYEKEFRAEVSRADNAELDSIVLEYGGLFGNIGRIEEEEKKLARSKEKWQKKIEEEKGLGDSTLMCQRFETDTDLYISRFPDFTNTFNKIIQGNTLATEIQKHDPGPLMEHNVLGTLVEVPRKFRTIEITSPASTTIPNDLNPSLLLSDYSQYWDGCAGVPDVITGGGGGGGGGTGTGSRGGGTGTGGGGGDRGGDTGITDPVIIPDPVVVQTTAEIFMENTLDQVTSHPVSSFAYKSLITAVLENSTESRPANSHNNNLGSFDKFIFEEGFTIFPEIGAKIAWLKKPFDVLAPNPADSLHTIDVLSTAYVDYNAENRSAAVDGVRGNAMYCTYRNEWQRYRVFIPAQATTYALLFKPEPEANANNLLYRVHLTFQPTTSRGVDHLQTLPLKYTDNSTSKNHSDLEDLFIDGKTVLLNIKNDGNNLISNRNPGVSSAGLILGKDKIEKYITSQGGGGWLFIDIAQDTKEMAPFSVADRKLQTLVYLDFEKEERSYQDWVRDLSPSALTNLPQFNIPTKYRNCNDFKEADLYLYDTILPIQSDDTILPIQ